jgi:hypothetical protein
MSSDSEPMVPEFVRDLSSVASPVSEPIGLDPDTIRELTAELRELEDARAAAVVSGRNYLVR